MIRSRPRFTLWHKELGSGAYLTRYNMRANAAVGQSKTTVVRHAPIIRPASARSGVLISGFTLLELLAVICILMILAVLVAPSRERFLAQAAQARCMANMRALHVGLGCYLNDHGNIWPQGPAPTAGPEWAAFWINILQPFGITRQTWECPVISKAAANSNRDQITGESIHYTPTMFDDKPGTARRWATQPWLVERADAHGNGALICFTDGSVKPFSKVLAEQGQR